MLLVLNVQTYRDAPAALSQNFTESGGTIGRSPGNHLVLDDPSKYISRTHALVTFRAGQFFLADMGSNPSVVNDRPLGKEREVALANGDRIAIGEYLLQAQITAAGDTPAAVADPLGMQTLGTPGGVAPPPMPVFEPPSPPAPAVLPQFDGYGQPAPAPANLPPMSTRNALAGASILDSPLSGGFGSQADPLGLNLFGAPPTGAGNLPGSIIGDPLGVGFRGSANDHAAPEHFAMPLPPVPAPFVAPPAGNPAPAVVPAPFSPPPATSASSAPSAPSASAVPIAPAPVPGAVSWSGGVVPEDYDPMADFLPPTTAQVPAPLAPPVPPAHTPPDRRLPDDFDPLAAVPGVPAALTPSDTPAVSLPDAATHESSAAPQGSPAGMVTRPAHDETRQPTIATAEMSVPAGAASAALEGGNVLASVNASAVPVQTPATPAGVQDATLAALLRGLGLPDLQSKLSGPELAELVGAMLREATGGAMQTLMARSVTKRESRVEMTIIASQANNPLKFFPDTSSALTQMLAQSAGGYMKPVRAFGNAFEDLQAHEMAVMAGMRAALSAVLKRFDPEVIEQRLDVPTVLDKMMASGRKAKMWDKLVALYAEISREADDDFQRLFGESFAQAYEDQVDRMHRRGK